MNDYGAVQELLDKSSPSSKVYLALMIFVGVNLLASIANIVLQLLLKNKEKKHYRLQLREDARFEVYEKIYENLTDLSSIDIRNSRQSMVDAIVSTENYIFKNKLFIQKKHLNTIMDFLDYFKSTVNDFRKKSYVVENRFFNKYIRYFNK